MLCENKIGTSMNKKFGGDSIFVASVVRLCYFKQHRIRELDIQSKIMSTDTQSAASFSKVHSKNVQPLLKTTSMI